MIRERWDLPGMALLAGACFALLFASANLAAQDFRAVSEPDSTSKASDNTTMTATPPEAATGEAVFDASAADSDERPVSREEKQGKWDKGPDAWKTIIYPVFAWAPVFGANVKLPSIPSGPGGGGGGGSITPEGSTSGSFNGAAFAGAEVLKSKWSMTANVLYAGMSGSRTSPKVNIGVDVIFGGAMVGHQLLLDGLSFEGGFRRMALNMNATVLDYPKVSRKPGVWDPLLGVTYRRQLSKKWRIKGHMDGGGFGVGCDYDLVEGASADWRFAKHFGMTMGVAALQFKISNTVSANLDNKLFLTHTFTLAQTTWGPEFGFGIFF